MKKVISILITLLMLCQATTFVNAEEAADDIELSNEMRLLEYLGIITPFDDGGYHLDRTVTRADMAAMISRMFAEDRIHTATGKVFTDVSADYWAADYIETLHSEGYISGDGTGAYNPEGPALYPHAVKLLVTALGYKIVAEQNEGYPAGYLSVAVKLDINDNIKAGVDSVLTYGDFYHMLYNTLVANQLGETSFSPDNVTWEETDKTLLKDKYSIIEVKGRVDANAFSYLYDNRKMDSRRIRIDGASYKVADDIDTTNLLGKYVECYAKVRGDEKEIIMLMPDQKYESIVISAKDLADSSGGFGSMHSSPSISYYEKNNSVNKQSIPKTASIIRNGIYIGRASEVADDMVIPSFGSVELIKNSNGECDVVRISSYKYYVIEFIDKNEYKLTDDFGKPEIDLGKDGMEYIVFSGNDQIAFTDLIEGDVIAVGANYDDLSVADFITIHRTTATIDGEITMIGDDDIMIGKNEYPLADEAVCNEGIFELGRKGKFYLGMDGEVVAAYFGKQNVDGYAYLRKMGIDSTTLEKDVQVLLFTTNNSMEIVSFAKNVSLNGAAPAPEVTVAASPVFKDGDDVKRQFVKIERNSKGEIKSIQTENVPGGIMKNASGLSDCFINKYVVGQDYLADENTWMFEIPLDKDAKDHEFKVESMKYYPSDAYQNVSIYDVDERYTAGLVARFKGSSVLSIDLGSRSAALVEKVTDSIVDDEMCKRVHVLIDGVSSYVDIPVDTYDTMKDSDSNGVGDKGVVAGDVFLYSTDANRVARVVNLLFDSEKDEDRMYSEWYASSLGMNEQFTNNSLLYTAHATVESIDGNIMLLNQNCLVDGVNVNIIRPHRIDGVNVYICDKDSREKVAVGYLGDLQPGQRVFIHGARTILREIIIYK